jgi:hypothetical protein
MLIKLFNKIDKIMKAGRFHKIANKFLAALLIVPSLAFADEVNIRNIDHTTIMTKDAMVILDKKAGKFWNASLDCNLPITTDSKVNFKTDTRTIKKGSELTFIIGSKQKDTHLCRVTTLAAL